jgi:HSP20 family molecular chaperone IbpA
MSQGSWMWAEAFDLLERAERLQRQFFRLGLRGGTAACWEPPVDVVETPDRLLVTVALPGVRPERVEVQVAPGAIVIRAARAAPVGARTGTIRRLEIPYGRFERSVELPHGNYEPTASEFIDGCLCIALAKRMERT